MSDRPAAFETRLLVGGELAAGTGAALEVVEPATEEVLVTLQGAGDEQVDAAIARGVEAQRGWWATPAAERAEALHAVAAALRERQAGLARVMTHEGGKPYVENHDEVDWVIACFDFYAELGRAEAGRVIPPVESSQLALVVKEPVGVVGAIVPWNYPLLLLAWKLAPALAAGNAVVCKPSEVTPLSTLLLGEALAEHLPRGLVSLLAGDGAVGARIAADERVGVVAFTGSVETGKRIAGVCAQRVARANLELGGKDAFVICPDVAPQLEIAARGAMWASFLNAGQVCTSTERIYVHRDVHEEFVALAVQHTRSLRVGDPFADTTDLGPMVNGTQRAKVEAQLAAAVDAGAEVLVGGDRAGHERGFFHAPTVVSIPHPPARGVLDTDLLREETFGPVAPIVRVDDLDEAVRLANGTRFGLGANVYTRDLETAVRMSRELRAGTVWINDPLTDNDAGPFGGFGHSGEGRELGREGLEAFQETKHVHLETKLERKDWWYPYGATP